MTQITLRGLDPAIELEIRKIAKKSGKSLNHVIQDMISRSAGPDKKLPAHSLKKLAGGWTEEDAMEFFEAIKSCEQIDADMWK
jgi:hypothetical protein